MVVSPLLLSVVDFDLEVGATGVCPGCCLFLLLVVASFDTSSFIQVRSSIFASVFALAVVAVSAATLAASEGTGDDLDSLFSTVVLAAGGTRAVGVLLSTNTSSFLLSSSLSTIKCFSSSSFCAVCALSWSCNSFTDVIPSSPSVFAVAAAVAAVAAGEVVAEVDGSGRVPVDDDLDAVSAAVAAVDVDDDDIDAADSWTFFNSFSNSRFCAACFSNSARNFRISSFSSLSLSLFVAATVVGETAAVLLLLLLLATFVVEPDTPSPSPFPSPISCLSLAICSSKYGRMIWVVVVFASDWSLDAVRRNSELGFNV
mmetsp:Transcript_28026/g.68071  ORF Transcript_28026/g.68071 Transcript_28026/m.68071 type:complete len:314 (-) Transcript_28026:1631-2572(-)